MRKKDVILLDLQDQFERESISIGEKDIFIASKTYEGEKYLTLVLDWIH